MKVITAPEEYDRKDKDVICFLAGGITNCADWQQEVIKELKDMESGGTYMDNLVIINPRRENFPIDDPNAAVEQIEWEFKWLQRANIFSMYFAAGESDQPICMYELGRNIIGMQWQYDDTWEDRIIISVEDGYKRQQDVNIQTRLATGKSHLVINHANPRHHAEAILITYTLVAEEV